MKLSLVLISFLFLFACKSSKNGESEMNELLLGEWRVSHEEGGQGEIILRPSEYNFPLSRIRDEFIFHKNNRVTYNTLGPADHPLTKKGKWEWTDEGLLKIYIDENNTFYWKVEELNEDVIQVQQRTDIN